MIEGVFVTEEELEQILAGNKPQARSQEKALSYYRAARFSYGLAYENYRSGELLTGIPLIRQISKTISMRGDYRRGDTRISGAKIIPPPGVLVSEWMVFFDQYVRQGFKSEAFLSFIAKQHVLFESVHPFEEGNGRTGRIYLNYLLISAGYPPIILKGDDKDKTLYYRALEQGDYYLRNMTSRQFNAQDVSDALKKIDASRMEGLIYSSLRSNLDRVIIQLLEEQQNLQLKPAKEVAGILGYSQDSIRTLIKRGKFIGVKRGKEWLTHEKLLLSSMP
jgi:Fic family protein